MKSNRKRTILSNKLELVCSAMNNKVYYSLIEQKRINHRKEVMSQLN